MIRVFIADDHSLFRTGLQQILARHPDLCVVGEAGTGADALRGIREAECDVLLLDITMPGRGGLDILKDVRRESPDVAILILSMHPEDQFAIRVLKAGASGYVSKESAADELIAAIRKVASGGRYVSAALAEKLAFAIGRNPEFPPHHMLSEREFQVVQMLATGMKLIEIADMLNLSEKTITTYRARILEKLHLHTNAELVHYAIDHKLIE
ncbi:MAG: response regulator transcription factor [Ignavibacteriae bacterium]|nr:response regulator transcription factor [Ignavibacteriota bacterium]